jgi:hypothetical protein
LAEGSCSECIIKFKKKKYFYIPVAIELYPSNEANTQKKEKKKRRRRRRSQFLHYDWENLLIA